MKKVMLICSCLLLMFLCGCSKERSEGDWVYTVKDGDAYLTQYKNRTEQIIIPDKIGKYAVVGLGENLFAETQTEVQSVVIPNTLTTIGVRAFANCKNLNSITIPESVKKIEAGLIPVDENGEEESDEYVILKCSTDENGEDVLETIEDDDEFERIADIFDDEFADIFYDDVEE